MYLHCGWQPGILHPAVPAEIKFSVQPWSDQQGRKDRDKAGSVFLSFHFSLRATEPLSAVPELPLFSQEAAVNGSTSCPPAEVGRSRFGGN